MSLFTMFVYQNSMKRDNSFKSPARTLSTCVEKATTSSSQYHCPLDRLPIKSLPAPRAPHCYPNSPQARLEHSNRRRRIASPPYILIFPGQLHIERGLQKPLHPSKYHPRHPCPMNPPSAPKSSAPQSLNQRKLPCKLGLGSSLRGPKIARGANKGGGKRASAAADAREYNGRADSRRRAPRADVLCSA